MHIGIMMYIITYVHVLFYIFNYKLYIYTWLSGSVKTGLMDYDNFDETLF